MLRYRFFRVIFCRALLGGLSMVPFIAGAAPGDDDPNRVIVRGRRPDQTRMEYPGSGLRFYPNGSSQDDLSAHLRRQGAYDAAPVERPSAFGFQLPRVRGQDARYTSLFIDDQPVADPYAALPLAEEIDLPAFDVVEVSSGAAPYDVPAVALRGAMRFRIFEADERGNSKSRVGVTASVPSGSTLSMRSDTNHEDADDNARGRLYLRQLNSLGNYRYYDDNGTPLNAGDDFVTRRANNDRASRFAMPAIEYNSGPRTLRAFAIWNESRQGIPSLLPATMDGGRVRERHEFTLGRVSLEYAPGAPRDPAMPGNKNTIGINAGIIDDHRVMEDPAASVLVVRERDDLRVKTVSFGAGWRGECGRSWISCRIDVRRDDSRVTRALPDASTDTSSRGLSRRMDHAVVAARAGDAESVGGVLEARLESKANDASRWTPGRSLTWKAGRPAIIRPWAQIAESHRSPSLLESQGDGARVLASPDVVPEAARHVEAGASYDTEDGSRALQASIFRDDTSDQIVIVPSSISSFRAINIVGDSSVTGVDLAAEQEVRFLPAGATRLGASWVLMRSRSARGDSLALPGVPADQGAISVAQPLWRRPWRSVVARLTSRRRGVVYRDVANDIRLPPWWIHDAAIDARWRCDGDGSWWCPRKSDLEFGIAVNNVADATSTTYVTSSGATGKTGYSDIWGVPLPGRSLTVSLAANL